MQMELSLRNLRGSVEKEQKPITEEGADLLRRVRRGEPGAEEEFVRLHSDGIRFYLRRRLGPEDPEARTRWLLAKVLGRVRQGLVTEDGVLAPDQVKRRLEDLVLHPALSKPHSRR